MNEEKWDVTVATLLLKDTAHRIQLDGKEREKGQGKETEATETDAVMLWFLGLQDMLHIAHRQCQCLTASLSQFQLLHQFSLLMCNNR